MNANLNPLPQYRWNVMEYQLAEKINMGAGAAAGFYSDAVANQRQQARPLLLFGTIIQCAFGQEFCLKGPAVKRYRPSSDKQHSIGFFLPECSGSLTPVRQRFRRKWYLSHVETQRFGPPDIVHYMRRSGLSTAAPDGASSQDRRFFSSHSGKAIALRGEMAVLGL